LAYQGICGGRGGVGILAIGFKRYSGGAWLLALGTDIYTHTHNRYTGNVRLYL
jgi:hypothetical protein